MSNKRILLDNEDFNKLTGGEIITKDGIDIALSDLGWDHMIELIRMHIADPKN